MSETPPPEQQPSAEDTPLSLAARILQLRQEHRSLDEEIHQLYERPYRDQLHLQRLKKKKLLVKDTIERLKDELIPDLNA